MCAGVAGTVLDEAAAEPRREAAGQPDHTLRVAIEQPRVDVRLAAREALEEAGRAEFDEVLEAGLVGGQQRQVVPLPPRLLLDLLDVVDEVGLEPMIGDPCRSQALKSSTEPFMTP